MLSSVARAPGTGRTQVVDFLDARQGDQGRRLAAILSEGFDAPQTAAQTRTAMETARGNAANVNYGAARAQAGAVDVTPAITEADNFLQPGVTRMLNPGNNIADDTVEAAVRRARAFLTDGRSQISANLSRSAMRWIMRLLIAHPLFAKRKMHFENNPALLKRLTLAGRRQPVAGQRTRRRHLLTSGLMRNRASASAMSIR
jgi:hypothetical protein